MVSNNLPSQFLETVSNFEDKPPCMSQSTTSNDSVVELTSSSFNKTGGNYFEFGKAIGNPYSPPHKKTAVKVMIVGAAILVAGAVGAACGALSIGTVAGGLAIGMAAVGSVLLLLTIYKSAITIFRKINAERFRLAYTPGLNNIEAPKLGIYSNTDLLVSNNAAKSFEWKKNLIESAQSSIELSANFAGGKPFRDVLNLIVHRMSLKPDLKAHLMLSRDLLEPEDIQLLDTIKKSNPNFVYIVTDRIYTTVPEMLSEENHVKLLVVDGKYFVMGGTGINKQMTREIVPKENNTTQSRDSKFIDKAFRDTDVIGYGQVAQTMRNQFFNLYRIWENRMEGNSSNRYFESKGDFRIHETFSCPKFHKEKGVLKGCAMKYIVNGPEHRKKNQISSEIAELTKNAQLEVRLANLLFNPDSLVKKALVQCKKNGVPIKGYFNGTGKNSSSSHYVYALPNRYNYNLLTEVFEYGVKDQLYHKKVITIDDRYSVVGSFNLGVKSALCDYESVVVIDDPRVTKLMNEALDVDALPNNSERLIGKKLKLKRSFSLLAGKVAIMALGTFFG